MSQSVVRLSSVQSQESRRVMALWKLSMVEHEFARGLIQLDMKTSIKYFREEHGFEVRVCRSQQPIPATIAGQS